MYVVLYFPLWQGRMAPARSLNYKSINQSINQSINLGLVVDYWSFVSASTRHSYSKLYYLCLLSSLIKVLPPPTPPPRPSRPPPNIHWPNNNEFLQKNSKKLPKTSHYLFNS